LVSENANDTLLADMNTRPTAKKISGVVSLRSHDGVSSATAGLHA